MCLGEGSTLNRQCNCGKSAYQGCDVIQEIYVLSPMLSSRIGACRQRPLLLQRLHGDSRVSDVCYEQECGSGWAIPAPVNIATAEALCGMARPSAASQEAARPDATTQASAVPCTTFVAGTSGAHLVRCAAVVLMGRACAMPSGVARASR